MPQLLLSQRMESLTAESKWYPVVSVDPDRLGGEPVFRGTRVPVQALFDYLKEGYSLDPFLEHFRGVGRQQAERVLVITAELVAEELRIS